MKVIDVLCVPDCPGVPPTLALVDEVLRALDALGAFEVRTTVIDSARAAGKARFVGSPTVRVAGVDIEAGERDVGLHCRLYVVDGKLENTPPRALVERAVRAALANDR